MPSTTVVSETELNGIKGNENGQKLLPNELFCGEVARANEFGEVWYLCNGQLLICVIQPRFLSSIIQLLKIASRVDGRSDGKDQNGCFWLWRATLLAILFLLPRKSFIKNERKIQKNLCKKLEAGPNRTFHSIQAGNCKHVIMNLPCKRNSF